MGYLHILCLFVCIYAIISLLFVLLHIAVGLVAYNTTTDNYRYFVRLYVCVYLQHMYWLHCRTILATEAAAATAPSARAQRHHHIAILPALDWRCS